VSHGRQQLLYCLALAVLIGALTYGIGAS